MLFAVKDDATLYASGQVIGYLVTTPDWLDEWLMRVCESQEQREEYIRSYVQNFSKRVIRKEDYRKIEVGSNLVYHDSQKKLFEQLYLSGKDSRKNLLMAGETLKFKKVQRVEGKEHIFATKDKEDDKNVFILLPTQLFYIWEQ